tara:strand:- start:712 stop:1527 length:816 start_codon:yes stop_codon:yes gene_type:complete
MLINDLEYFELRANYCNTTHGIDSPKSCLWPVKDWYNYPIQNFDYQFNSWGFRGPEYDQYIGKPVNLCLGDSATVNIGGPIEHSWCSQLALHFDIPTLNLGLEGVGNDAIRLIYDRACDLFDVQNTFVMYGYLHRRLVDRKFKQDAQCNEEENFEYFLNHRIPNAFECAIPYWCFNNTEIEFLTKQGITLFGSKRNSPTLLDKQRYNFVKGADWPSYNEYVAGADCDEAKDFYLYVDPKIFKNRDGHHMNQETNKIYADYLYNQWKQKNES